MTVSAQQHQRLIRMARAATRHAYAPYSRFRVGAAILLNDGRFFSGCNVENASYGLTICAERNAIFCAVAASSRKPRIVAAAVVNDREIPCSPCGACRQVLAEFGPRAVVFYPTAGGFTQRTMQELLVDGFTFNPDSSNESD